MRVLDAAGRVRDRAKVGWSSSVAFATLGTSLTTLIALPLLTIAYDVLLGADMASLDAARTGYASALVAVMTSVAGGVVSAVVADRNLGIFQEVHSYRRVDVLYWLSSAVVPATLALVTAVAALASVGALSGQWRAGALMALPLAVVCGLLLGVAAGGMGVNLSDPYLGSTILVAVAPILSGVIVPLGVSPAWLRWLAFALPGGGMVGMMDDAGAGPGGNLTGAVDAAAVAARPWGPLAPG